MTIDDNSQANVTNYKCPKFKEFFAEPMYMEQLISTLDKCFAPFEIPGEEKIITATMVNNYVKQGIIPAPVKKKYSVNHIVYLFAIGILKNVLSISEIGIFIERQIFQYPLEIAYNFFAIELENSLRVTFGKRDFAEANSEKEQTPLSKIARSALLAFANQVYVKKNLNN